MFFAQLDVIKRCYGNMVPIETLTIVFLNVFLTMIIIPFGVRLLYLRAINDALLSSGRFHSMDNILIFFGCL